MQISFNWLEHSIRTSLTKFEQRNIFTVYRWYSLDMTIFAVFAYTLGLWFQSFFFFLGGQISFCNEWKDIWEAANEIIKIVGTFQFIQWVYTSSVKEKNSLDVLDFFMSVIVFSIL
jgi:hypothetical protein